MKKLNIFPILVLVFLAATNVTAQTAKFDIMTYTAPAGFAVEKDAGSIRFSKESGGNFCVISLTRSADSVGESALFVGDHRRYACGWLADRLTELNKSFHRFSNWAEVPRHLLSAR